MKLQVPYFFVLASLAAASPLVDVHITTKASAAKAAVGFPCGCAELCNPVAMKCPEYSVCCPFCP